MQRRLFFAFKMRIPEALNFSLHMALILLPLGETFARIVPDAAPVPAQSTSDRQVVSFLWRQLLFAAVSFCVTFSWESCHQLIQVCLSFVNVVKYVAITTNTFRPVKGRAEFS